jgi:uncharacterized protein (DUF58 family)
VAWPRVKLRSVDARATSATHVELDTLIRLQFGARGFSLLPRQPIHSILAGRRASRLRGRGLDFEELRAYQPGDDVRGIDWKATARTRVAQLRVYTEERDRPALYVIDQRHTMFFGSRVKMKSVVAAEAAALGAWRSLDQGDRVGAIIFDDHELRTVRPRRSEQAVMQVLAEIVRANGRLSSEEISPPVPGQLNHALAAAAQAAGHDALVVVISDFAGMNDETRVLFSRLAARGDALAAHVWDPLEAELPAAGRLAFQAAEGQVEVDTGSAPLRERFAEDFRSRFDDTRASLQRLGVPVLSVRTTEPVLSQLREQLGASLGRSRPA